MEMRIFGRSGMRLSVLGFGCGAVGGLMVRGEAADQERTIARAIDNGVTREEITEVITHMAFYAGWPAAMSAAQVAYTVLVEGNKGE